MPGCCVAWCGINSSTHRGKGGKKRKVDPRTGRLHTFHNLPANESLKDRWLEIIYQGGKPREWQPNQNTKICSKHFRVQDIGRNSRGAFVHEGALPSIPKSDKVKKMRKSNNSSSPAVPRAKSSQNMTQIQTQTIEIELSYVDLPPEPLPDLPAHIFEVIPTGDDAYSALCQELLGDVGYTPNGEVTGQELAPVAEASPVCKKVVSVPDNGTFDSQPEGLCKSMHGEMMGIMEKFAKQLHIENPKQAAVFDKIVKGAENILSTCEKTLSLAVTESEFDTDMPMDADIEHQIHEIDFQDLYRGLGSPFSPSSILTQI